MLDRVHAFTAPRRWIWPLIGLLLLWAALGLLTERFSLYSLSGVATSASFLLLPALGQMLVISTGRGHIDLSIPSVVTLAAYLATTVSEGQNSRLVLVLAAVVLCGLLVGTLNAAMVIVLRIPAMIATLASGYILATATLIVNAKVGMSRPAPALADLASGRIGPLPFIAIAAVSIALLASVMLSRASWGRRLLASGQSAEAARLTGIRVGRIDASAFIASAVLAALAGLLLAGYANGAFLEMGAPYLLQSVGAVVLGGTLIAGGSATVLGTLFGAMLLVMIVTTMQIAGLPSGIQDILQGVVIIAVLSVAGARVSGRA